MRKIFFSAAIIFLLTICFGNSAQAVWRLDGTNEKNLPRNFRMMTDDWNFEDGNREGLENLKSSASGQPSLESVKVIFKKIKKISPNSEIYMVDLRQESHGFADGYPVSWYTEKNRGNFNIGFDEVEAREAEQLKNLQGTFSEFVPLGNADKKLFQEKKFAPKKTFTERQIAEAAGFNYVRFAATDMIFPAPQVVDEFLNFVKNLPENSWLHFHCQAGHGRTTTFLIFYDILKNPELSLEEICKRQHYLGGANFLSKSSGNDWYAESHNNIVDKLKLFYKFAHEKSGETWTEFYLKNL